MADCGQLIKDEFPHIDDELYQYIDGVLANGCDDFENIDDLYEAVGEVLEEVAEDKTADDIRDICTKLFRILKPNYDDDSAIKNGPTKVLNAPIHLGSMNTNLDNGVDEIKSIWVNHREDGFKVDQKKLEKAEAKLQQKQGKRNDISSKPVNTTFKPETATASQVTSKKDAKLEAKGTNRTTDIRIENFDIAYGDRVLLQGTDIVLAFGRRYGLVGRNGLGKTTLLRLISR
uniref:ATP-binding cassette sub-family F member 3 n=1 Tax=Cacopsylla melanoneura TaxID=428564 RepID=A0A8D8U455_9HEMI